MELMVSLDPSLKKPLTRQLYDSLRQDILAGRLKAGARMPSTRGLAEALHVSRITVTQAYEQLLSEGYLESRSGSGTYVSPRLSGDVLPGEDPPVPPAIEARLSAYGRHLRAAGALDVRPKDLQYNFRHGRADYSRFPLPAWRRLLLRHYRSPQLSILDYAPDARGVPELREAIAQYLVRARSLRCTAEQVVIVNGSQQALQLIAEVLADPGDAVGIEDPCYAGARRVFETRGARLLAVPVDEAGLQVELLAKSRAAIRFVYTTPSHQFPTGGVLPLQRRLQLLDWAERRKAMVIEDDYDSEYRYEGHPLPSMQGLEAGGRVLYVGTFSKVLFPALRLGYIVAPLQLAPLFARAKWLSDRQAPMLEQHALADFIRTGALERHIRRMRRLYDSRRKLLVDLLQRHLGARVSVQGENTGMHLMVRFHTRLTDAEIIRRAAAAGVAVQSARPCYVKARYRNQLILGYANMTEDAIREGVKRLARVIDERV